ncbi:protein kinase [Xanthomonas sp. 10-10]|uniref:Protein kinase n=1 Tax=Xanthomonas sp. 10-10 TaxID=3115848 RepID=A0AAU7P6R0_9XANT
MSIIKFFQKNPLYTSVGNFTYAEDIGEGGNAKVLAFKKGNLLYAVKFLPHGQTSSLARFRDEFFCAAQIPSHPNVARAFHLDQTEIEGKKYSLIIMKRYQENLHRIGTISSEEDGAKAQRGWMLLTALCSGVDHLHTHEIIHRDIKPHNIFLDKKEDTFVVGDLGIAHFSDDLYAREAATKHADRLANFACCAPEQLIPGTVAARTMDIFALGQVLNWYIRGSFIRGGGRQPYHGANKDLELLDRIIDRCIKDNPDDRFQHVGKMHEFAAEFRNPPKDAWAPIRNLDQAFRSSVPQIPELYETTDQKVINRFLKNFATRCDPHDYWYARSDGGDNKLDAISELEGRRWLVAKIYECHIEKIIFYKYPGEWQSFFVLLIAADSPFEITDSSGKKAMRKNVENWTEDAATLYDGRYMEVADAENGYFLNGDEMIEIDYSKAEQRHRFLKDDALLIIPHGSGIAGCSDRTPIKFFLREVVNSKSTDKNKIIKLLDATTRYTSSDITDRL